MFIDDVTNTHGSGDVLSCVGFPDARSTSTATSATFTSPHHGALWVEVHKATSCEVQLLVHVNQDEFRLATADVLTMALHLF